MISVGVGVLLCRIEGVGLGDKLYSAMSGSGVGVQSDQRRPANSRRADILFFILFALSVRINCIVEILDSSHWECKNGGI